MLRVNYTPEVCKAGEENRDRMVPETGTGGWAYIRKTPQPSTLQARALPGFPRASLEDGWALHLGPVLQQ